MAHIGRPAEDAWAAIQRQLDDWDRGEAASIIADEEPCPICHSRLRHLCETCVNEIEGKLAFRMLKTRELVEEFVDRFQGDPPAYIEAVVSSGLTADVVSIINYGAWVEALEIPGRVSETAAKIMRQPTLQWQFLLAVLAQPPVLESPKQVASWFRFGVIDLSIGVPGGDRVAFPGGIFAEQVSSATREMACKNLSRPAPSPAAAHAKYRRLLTDPQQGVRGWAALRLTDLEPSTSGLHDCLRSMQSWSGGPVESKDYWDHLESRGIFPIGSLWRDLAARALEQLALGNVVQEQPTSEPEPGDSADDGRED